MDKIDILDVDSDAEIVEQSSEPAPLVVEPTTIADNSQTESPV